MIGLLIAETLPMPKGGKGQGPLLCLRGTEEPSTPDPCGENLTAFQLIWSDTYE